MDAVRTISLVVASLLLLGGLVAIVALELSSAERRIVGRVRDTVEVILPVVLTAVLIGFVWSRHGLVG